MSNEAELEKVEELEENAEEIEQNEDEETEEGLQEEVADSEGEPEEDSESESDSEAENTSDDEEDDGVYLSFGDDEVEKTKEDDGGLVKHLRRSLKDSTKEKRELQAKLAELQRQQQSDPVKPEDQIGKKPDLEDYDWDQDAFAEALIQWNAKKQEIEKEIEQKREAERQEAEKWQNVLDNYKESKQRIRNDDFELVENVVLETLSQEQHALILASSDKPALEVYMLGKNPDDLKRLSEIKDQARFVYELAKLQATKGPKMAGKKKPAPEKRVKGSAPRVNGKDAKLQRLREEAQRTGDFTKVAQYKRSLSK